MAKKKRAPTAYNRHIGREMRAGRSMKQAAASWRGKPTATRRTARRGRSNKPMAKRRSYRRRVSAYLKPMDAITGGILYALAEPKLNQLATSFGLGLSDDAVKFGAGFLVSRHVKNKYAKSAGNAAMYIGAARFAQSFNLGGMFSPKATQSKPSGLLF